jgi:MOSC domain-containing protein YiiM
VDLGHRLTGPNAITSEPRLLTVNIVHRIHPGYFHDTAIDKQPVDRPVELTATGLAGDRQLDPHHGGSDKAVYAYATEDANWWATQLGRTVPPGLFGENLRTQDLDVSGAIIGEKWRIGTVLLEVRMPRTPCQNLSMRIGIGNFHIRFNTTGRVGAMLKVHEPGLVCAGDPITVVDRPHHGVRVRPRHRAGRHRDAVAPRLRHPPRHHRPSQSTPRRKTVDPRPIRPAPARDPNSRIPIYRPMNARLGGSHRGGRPTYSRRGARQASAVREPGTRPGRSRSIISV